MFELDPYSSHMMPAHFGSAQRPEKATMWYRDITSMVVAYRTDRDKLAAYLPAPFEVGEDPVVTVTYACNREVDWLAGHGYNLIAVNASAIFRGEEETLEGDYTLVIWENLTDPILTGRELQGIPKLYADIPQHTIFDGEWQTSASHFSHRFLDVSVKALRAPTTQELSDNEQAKAGKDNPMGWRFMPGLLGFGQSINEFVTYPSKTEITEAWVGEGRLDWHATSWEQNPTQHHIIEALAALPVREYLPAVVAKGSTNLILPERLPRLIK